MNVEVVKIGNYLVRQHLGVQLVSVGRLGLRGPARTSPEADMHNLLFLKQSPND